MNKDKAIELIKEIEHNLYLINSMLRIREGVNFLVTKVDLNMQKCEQALKELEEEK